MTIYRNLRISWARLYEPKSEPGFRQPRNIYSVGFRSDNNPGRDELPWQPSHHYDFDKCTFGTNWLPIITYSDYTLLIEAFQIADLRNIPRDVLLIGAMCDVIVDSDQRLIEVIIHRHTIQSSRDYVSQHSKAHAR